MSGKNKYTLADLKQRQAYPLDVKIQLTIRRIYSWIKEYGVKGVYVAFSGGKDSTVLLDIVRKEFPEVLAVFVDTGLEYPEVRAFAKSFPNVEVIKPKMNFRQVIEKYGYPMISKEVSECIYECRESKNKTSLYRYEQLMGLGKFANGNRYAKTRWQFLMNAPFKISHRCCGVMKKGVSHKYNKDSGRHPITGQMAEESILRTSQWVRNGCNGFDMKEPISNPMAFWTEQDVLRYIKINNLPIASVYGDIVVDGDERQMDICDLGVCEDTRKLRTTGCQRTGCMFCGFGCHLDKGEGRFERMKRTHPKQYEYIMRPWEKGGLGYKEVIDWINENGKTNIKY